MNVCLGAPIEKNHGETQEGRLRYKKGPIVLEQYREGQQHTMFLSQFNDDNRKGIAEKSASRSN